MVVEVEVMMACMQVYCFHFYISFDSGWHCVSDGQTDGMTDTQQSRKQEARNTLIFFYSVNKVMKIEKDRGRGGRK